jgi:hypothetical protein
MRDLGCEVVNPSISIANLFLRVHSIIAMKGIRFFNYFGRIFSTYETEDGHDMIRASRLTIENIIDVAIATI